MPIALHQNSTLGLGRSQGHGGGRRLAGQELHMNGWRGPRSRRPSCSRCTWLRRHRSSQGTVPAVETPSLSGAKKRQRWITARECRTHFDGVELLEVNDAGPPRALCLVDRTGLQMLAAVLLARFPFRAIALGAARQPAAPIHGDACAPRKPDEHAATVAAPAHRQAWGVRGRSPIAPDETVILLHLPLPLA